ncbi:Trihelix transcription factor [Actinidia chinensis var. chinensis]|uniref:Trihelix transcription factor n=1 Tax=Actinidia chinensis var. chinensis TaxID=1590841 RepID=A0A2R6QG64_ACTCC|nr:Trihelix transcription factor [Actinidia chinensis var. chinensis]
MAPETNDVHELDAHPTNGVNGKQATIEGTNDKSKSQRHPRWTRQETLILIEGKQIAENRGRKRHISGSVCGLDQLESKWDAVSSFCREYGVNRGPVQCRKRWSNLVGDFRKLKAWESQVKGTAESFWMMRNDVKREKKLPSFFDREVYDVLDGRAFTATAYPLTLVTITADAKYGNGLEAVVEEEEDVGEEAEAVFDSTRDVASKNGMLSDFQQLEQEGNGRCPEKQAKTVPSPMPISDTRKGKQLGLNSWRGSMSQEGWKKKRLSLDGCGDTNLEEQLVKVLEKNSSLLNAQLEAQNMNYQLDREQRKDQNDSLVAALSKIRDALGRIVDKL